MAYSFQWPLFAHGKPSPRPEAAEPEASAAIRPAAVLVAGLFLKMIDYAALLENQAAGELERARRSVAVDFHRLHGRAPTVEEVDGIIAKYWYRLSDEAFELHHRQRRARERRNAAA